jgi:rhodanese-related sulfurtransferase
MNAMSNQAPVAGDQGHDGSQRVAESGVREVDARTAAQWVKAGSCVLVDVREADEHARERIAGARLVPLSAFDSRQVGAKPGQRVVFQCRSGKRSMDAARLSAGLSAAGVEIYNLTGGINAWKEAQLPVQTNTSVSGISVMRQVQLVIGLGVLAGAALTWLVHPAFVLVPAFFGAGLTFAGATGTCGLASVLGAMPWNKSSGSCGSSGSSCCG